MTDDMRRFVVAVRAFAHYLPGSIQLAGPAETSRLQLIDAAEMVLAKETGVA